MAITKYKKALRNFLIYVIVIVIMFLILALFPNTASQDLTLYIPGRGFIEGFLIFVGFWTLGGIIGGVLFGYLLAPLYLLVQKKIFGRNMIYGIQDNPKSEKFKVFSRAIFPALMAINFSLIFASKEPFKSEIPLPLPGVSEDWLELMNFLITFLVMLSISVGASFAIFSPVWFVLDGGLVYSNQKKVMEKQLEQPIMGRAVGDWYMDLLKGYAGISVIISYLLIFFPFLIALISNLSGAFNTIVAIINILILIPLVFLIALASIPMLIILDLIKESRIKYIRKWANRFGIKDHVKISFETIN